MALVPPLKASSGRAEAAVEAVVPVTVVPLVVVVVVGMERFSIAVIAGLEEMGG